MSTRVTIIYLYLRVYSSPLSAGLPGVLDAILRTHDGISELGALLIALPVKRHGVVPRTLGRLVKTQGKQTRRRVQCFQVKIQLDTSVIRPCL